MERLEHFVMWMLLSLVTLLVLFNFISASGNVYQNNAFDTICNDYLRVDMMSNQFTGFTADAYPCRTTDITIQGSVYDAMRETSDALVSCYNTFFRGEEELFPRTREAVNFCAVCHHISYDLPQDINGWELLLFQENTKLNSRETYLQALDPSKRLIRFDAFSLSNPLVLREDGEVMSATDNELVEFLSSLREHDVKADGSYVTLFMYNKTSGMSGLEFASALGISTGAGAAIGLGAAVIGGIAIVGTGGLALTVIIPAAAAVAVPVGGVAGGVVGYQVLKSTPGSQWTASVNLVQADALDLQALGCESVIGVQEPGITTSN